MRTHHSGNAGDERDASPITAAKKQPGAPPHARTTSVEGILALQATVGNAAVVQMLRQAAAEGQHSPNGGQQDTSRPGQTSAQRSTMPDVLRSPGRPLNGAADTGGHDAGVPAVQRTILVVNHETNDYSEMIDEEDEVSGSSAFADLGLTPDMIAHLQRLAADEEYYTAEEALAMVRHTVTGGVNVVSKKEADFLGDLAGRRSQVSSYDPDMTPAANNILAAVGVPAGAVEVHRASITAFGRHVPHTDIFVPHPGPWTNAPPPNDLASCLDEVMGAASHAYVLTDNEPAQGFADSLLAGIERVNSGTAGAADHRPLTVTVKELDVPEGTEIELGDPSSVRTAVPFKPHHRPDYRLVHVSRA